MKPTRKPSVSLYYRLLFLKRTADVMAPHLSVVFWWLVRLGSFPACWRQANVTQIPKGPLSSVASYRPISTTSVLSKVFERLVSVCLGRFMEGSGVLPTTQFVYQKCLGTCDALLACCELSTSAPHLCTDFYLQTTIKKIVSMNVLFLLYNEIVYCLV